MRPEVQREVDRLLDRIGDAIEADAKRHCPVDTGDLRDSIRVVKTDDGIAVGSDLDYADDVERGTRKMAAQPFLRPALYQERGAL